jgi:acetyl esterase
MAAAVTLLAKERRGQILHSKRSSIQSLMLTLTLPHTWRTKEAILALTRKAMKWFWDNYAPDNATQKEPQPPRHS